MEKNNLLTGTLNYNYNYLSIKIITDLFGYEYSQLDYNTRSDHEALTKILTEHGLKEVNKTSGIWNQTIKDPKGADLVVWSSIYINPAKDTIVSVDNNTPNLDHSGFVNYGLMVFTKKSEENSKLIQDLKSLPGGVELGKKERIRLVMRDNSGTLYTDSFSIKKSELVIEDNYNDDFSNIHDILVENLSKEGKGIALLHGKPGTGKTHYLRHLISILDRRILVIPPNLIEELSSPHFLNFLIEQKNSILVIEDAENAIKPRGMTGSSVSVSNLLNIADGILSDILNIQLVCSFNADLQQVDPALLRKGRLIAKYEFEELSVKKSQNLSDKLGFDVNNINKKMTLSEIYNQKELSFNHQRKTVGF